jgi:hypothetical protein
VVIESTHSTPAIVRRRRTAVSACQCVRGEAPCLSGTWRPVNVTAAPPGTPYEIAIAQTAGGATIQMPGQANPLPAAWEGQKLVVSTTTPTGRGPVAVRHAYSLDGDRLTLEMSGTNPDGSPAPTRTVVYARAILEPLPPPTSRPVEAGYTSLFNGRDLTGWRTAGPADAFTVDRGALPLERRHLDHDRVPAAGASGEGLRGPDEARPTFSGRCRDRITNPFNRVLIQRFAAFVSVAKLAVDDEHPDSVHDRPDESRKEERVVASDEPRLLLFDERIDQHLEGRPGLLHERRIPGTRLQEPAEHHPIVGRMLDGKAHVRQSHGFESFAPAPVLLPGIRQREPKPAESFPADGGQERLLVSEMAIERRAGDAQRPADRSQRELLDAVGVNGPQRLLEQRPLQVAMVILPGPLLAGSDSSRSRHVRSF